MRQWHIECKKCEKSTDISVGDFRKIIQASFEFILKPAFVCSKCNEECTVTLKEGEKK
jgi:hypothetical protein